jgi:hypothetical protein
MKTSVIWKWKLFSFCIVPLLFGLVHDIHAVPVNNYTYDNFNDNSLSSNKWIVSITGTGPSLQETNNRIEIFLPGTSQPSNGIMGAGINSKCKLSGDFTIQVDYELIQWPKYPEGNGVRVGLTAGPNVGAVMRLSPEKNEVDQQYVTDFRGHIDFKGNKYDMSGKLRMVRTGNVFSGYFWDGTGWVIIGTANLYYPDPDAELYFGVAAWTHPDIFSYKDTLVAFDNLTIVSGDLVGICEDELEVKIDIKPGSDPNSINLDEKGLLPVAIWGSASLDVNDIDPSSVKLAGIDIAQRGSSKAPKAAYSLEDVNGDGRLDFIAHFDMEEMVSAEPPAITDAMSYLIISGKLKDGRGFSGSDSIRIVPPESTP